MKVKKKNNFIKLEFTNLIDRQKVVIDKVPDFKNIASISNINNSSTKRKAKTKLLRKVYLHLIFKKIKNKSFFCQSDFFWS